MARKAPADLSPAYAKRLARGEAQGKTRQEARGHKAGEHIIRRRGGAKALTAAQIKRIETAAKQKARYKSTGLLSDKDKRYARLTGRKWAEKLQMPPADGAQRGLERMQRFGAAKFRAAVILNRKMYREYLREIEEGSYESRGEELLDILAFEDAEPDTRWYYYHTYS